VKWNGGFVVNKAKVYCVASAVAVCVASNPNMDVLAKQVQPVKLEEKAQQTITADDFIKQYLSIKEIVKDSTNKDVEKYKADKLLFMETKLRWMKRIIPSY